MIVVSRESARSVSGVRTGAWGDFVERSFHGRIAQGEPALQQVNAQHGFQRIRFLAAAGLRVERLDELQQATL